ncbi:MAG TPA: class I SAM-dependent methyltransferase [Acidobacteriaceae bacterium]|nr:class I SAM-dependent methyltransferase [Acidobacteriaceae bacterium]
MANWKFEETKDTPLGHTTDAAASKFRELGYEPSDYYNYFPCFMNARTLARYMSLYELYKATLGLAGHIAEVGVYRGGVSLLFAKLMLLHEPHTITQVHGFDWWREPSNSDETYAPDIERGPAYDYSEPYDRIMQLIAVQGLQRWAVMHRLNVQTELEPFFAEHSHLQFKLVFLDAGDYETVARSILEFWPRLLPGGIMIFDQFNHEVAPGESRAVRELLPEDAVIRAFPHGWMPTAYVVKGERASDRARDVE